MDGSTVAVFGVVLLLALLVLGIHIGVALGVVGLFGIAFLTSAETATSVLASTSFAFATTYEMLIIPLFVFMGLVAAEAGVAANAYGVAVKWFGRMPGGLGVATLIANAIFGTCTGSSVAAATVFARIAAPEMRRYGYGKDLVYGLVATAGIIGMLIPPSGLIVVYGLFTGESIGRLLIAGIGPGLVLTFSMSIVVVLLAKLNPATAPTISLSVTWRERFVSLTELWALGIVALAVIGGIYAGVTTATEAAAVAALVIVLVGFASRRLRLGALPPVLRESVNITAMIFLIFIGARVFSRFLILSGLAPQLMSFIVDLHLTQTQFLVALSLLYLVAGMFLDSISMLAITMPMIYPVAKTMGFEPMWFAMVVIVVIEVGLVTPPVGLNVYAVKGVAGADASLEGIFRGVVPFYLALLLTLGLVIAFPPVSNYLPQTMSK